MIEPSVLAALSTVRERVVQEMRSLGHQVIEGCGCSRADPQPEQHFSVGSGRRPIQVRVFASRMMASYTQPYTGKVSIAYTDSEATDQVYEAFPDSFNFEIVVDTLHKAALSVAERTHVPGLMESYHLAEAAVNEFREKYPLPGVSIRCDASANIAVQISGLSNEQCGELLEKIRDIFTCT